MRQINRRPLSGSVTAQWSNGTIFSWQAYRLQMGMREPVATH